MASAFLKWLNRVVVGEPEERNEEATQETNDMNTQQASSEEEEPVKQKDRIGQDLDETNKMLDDAIEELTKNLIDPSEHPPVPINPSDLIIPSVPIGSTTVTSPDTNQLVPKKKNILIIPTTITDCPETLKHLQYNDTNIEDSFIVANHIVKKEMFSVIVLENSPARITNPVVSFDHEVTHNDETYSFNIGYVRVSPFLGYQNDDRLMDHLAYEIPRYVAGLHLVIFVTSCTKSIPVTKSIIKRFPPEAQSISLLVVTQCNRDKNMSDKERKDIIEEFDAWCGSYKMKKGIIPVCFRDDDFHLSGPRKRFHARRIREDEEILHDLIINQCEEMVPVKSILISGVGAGGAGVAKVPPLRRRGQAESSATICEEVVV